MRAVDIIAKKRDGGALSKQEIDFFIAGYSQGTIPDYQASAWLMATLLRGMDTREVVDLTLAMARSGRMLSLREVAPVVADKHSTGGVGDKTTLIVAPLVAAAGLPVAKMSGRALGFTGGTLDKLESIPGFQVSLGVERFIAQVAQCGIAIAGQSQDLAPADGKFYALRDATATVPSIPLIASSIMSKKIAAGADVVVLDVKVGRGAFMKTLDSARELARLMVQVGDGASRRVLAVLGAMDQPLGHAVGNALEVREAIDCLQGHGPQDLTDHCLAIAGYMLLVSGVAPALAEALALARRTLESGSALDKFVELLRAQDGDPRVVEKPEAFLPRAPVIGPVLAQRTGYVAQVDAERVGWAAVGLGAGRERKEDAIDPSVGIVLHKKVGDAVQFGEPVFSIHARGDRAWATAAREVMAAYTWSEAPVAAPVWVPEVIK